jgi:hypothetical protein
MKGAPEKKEGNVQLWFFLDPSWDYYSSKGNLKLNKVNQIWFSQ